MGELPMKGYRKLAPGEIIREGDFVQYAPTRGRQLIGAEPGRWQPLSERDKGWRKARTDGTPPGWRWADAGEKHDRDMADYGTSRAFKDHSAHILPKFDSDQPETLGIYISGYVMPYPEDPRLD